jgi:ribosome biogenesis GTPase / thiamine phosphate phosphatase
LAKRDKLTQNQKRQIAKTRARKKRKQQDLEIIGELGELHRGLLISRFGEQADVMGLISGTTYRCYLRQNLGAPVPGDRVQFRLDNNQQGVIETVEDRDTLLQRPSFHQGLKPVVANIDRIFIIVAPLPDFSSVLLDRYIIAIEQTNIEFVIVANKYDLNQEYQNQNIDKQLEIYSALGYQILKISTKLEDSKSELKQAIENHSSILVGQSGVGKSSIINWLFPTVTLHTQIISENSRLGQHTTTASQLFCLDEKQPQNGFIIDSPGIREFGLWHLSDQAVADGYVEFSPYIGTCKFRDCKHINEPGCEIIKAVSDGKISQQRWHNYCKIIAHKSPNE